MCHFEFYSRQNHIRPQWTLLSTLTWSDSFRSNDWINASLHRMRFSLLMAIQNDCSITKNKALFLTIFIKYHVWKNGLVFFSDYINVKNRFETRFVKAGEGPSRICSLLFSILFGQLFKNRLMIKNVHSECYLKLSACRVFCEAISIQAFSFVESLQTLI